MRHMASAKIPTIQETWSENLKECLAIMNKYVKFTSYHNTRRKRVLTTRLSSYMVVHQYVFCQCRELRQKTSTPHFDMPISNPKMLTKAKPVYQQLQ